MTLFTRSCHGPNGRFTLSCAGSVFGTQLMPYFVKSTSLVSNNVIRRYIRVNFKVKVNLGQSSCYFDLRSNFQLDLPKSKGIYFDASWREKHDGAWIIPLKLFPVSRVPGIPGSLGPLGHQCFSSITSDRINPRPHMLFPHPRTHMGGGGCRAPMPFRP